MSESLRSLRWDWIAFGWFMAVAVASGILLAFNAVGSPESAGDESFAVAVSLVMGFLLMGYFVGTRVVAAPVAHGVAMALLSLVAWLAANFLGGAVVGAITWWPIDQMTIVSLFLLQAIAAVLGTRLGVRRARAVRQGS